MTKESLEQLLVDYGVSFTSALADRLLEEFNPGICEDVISRQAIIEWLKAKDIIKLSSQEEMARKELKALPSVNLQEPKTGHWIEQEEYNGDVYYECSVCGEPWITIDGTPCDNNMNYCPNCGTHMVESEGAE